MVRFQRVNMKKKNYNKAPRANVHKRRSRDAAKRALLRELDSIGVGHDSCVFGGGDIMGKRGADSRVTVRGVFSSARGGYGFVTPDTGEGKRDVFIPEGKTLGAIDGDLVECTYRAYRGYSGEEKTEGRVTKIVKIGRETIIGALVGEYARGRGFSWLVVPDDTHINIRPRVLDTAGALEGDKVSVRVLRGTGTPLSPMAEILCVYGDSASRTANYEAILDECNIPKEFTKEEIREAEDAAKNITLGDRKRYTGAPVFTIDGEGAKDLDDAVSLRRIKGGWYLGVHIADVSSFVGEKTALDRCAMSRATSVYFTDKVVPMLPEALSNGACSLNPKEDKLTLSAMITLSDEGEVRGVKLVKGIITSEVRGVYSEVNALFSGSADAEIKEKYKKVYPSLFKMRELYLLLEKKARLRGMLELSMPEAEIIIGEDGEPSDIVLRSRGVAERMIEQFMLTANEAVAGLLLERGVPFVSRVHEPPPDDRLHDFITYLHNLGFDTSYISFEKCSQENFVRVLAEAEKRGLSRAVSYSMLRSMSKAYYSERSLGHFGLALGNYCHFTSPIRRLSDLATHRIIHKVLLEGAPASRFSSYAARAARAASEGEERALLAERRIEDLYRTIYMSRHIGEEFSAVVSSVQSFGVFAELDNTCEGLLPISELPGYFVYDERTVSLRSRDRVLRVGDRINIRIESADVSRGRIEFSLVL